MQRHVQFLQRMERVSPRALRHYQRRQLEALLRHARSTVPFYRTRLDPVFRPDDSIDWRRWGEIPILTRQDMLDRPDDIASRSVPEAHGRVSETRTSGSTGEIVKTMRTSLGLSLWAATTTRYYDWHGIDCTRKLASIRGEVLGTADYPNGRHDKGWAQQSGTVASLNVTTPIHLQAEWLARERPDYLLSFATNLGALADFIAQSPDHGPRFPLAGIMSCCEILSEDVREACMQTFETRVADNYSSEECGYMALQCPESDTYHVQSEALFLELLDDDGGPVPRGELGRIIATPLYNYAMPLIRYEMRDYAVAGDPCACGRTAPVLTRIAGRSRNLFRFPGGIVVQPNIKTVNFMKYLRPRQWQVIQTAPLKIEVHLVPGEDPESMDFDGMEDYIRRLLHDDLEVEFKLVNEIPVSRGGKHEDYICALP
ncbi:MAG: phenylacetate--CoA ligase family protein [Methyloligellaceae bacterium]